MEPLVFESYLRPQVWGGRELETRLGKRLPDAGPYGEAWEISAHAHHVSRVAEGPLAGRTLADLWREQAVALTGKSGPAEEFPLLVKLLDCHDLLSVQVHPSDELARKLRGEPRGKTEAWVVLAAGPDARIYAGLRAGVTRGELEARLDQGAVAECLHWFVPRPGDFLLLNAGVVHAVGGGVLIAEVQQSSDATFRLFDWNRLGSDGQPRALHRTEALQCIDWQAGPQNPNQPLADETLPGGTRRERLVRCAYFELDRYRLAASLPMPLAGRMSIWMVVAGAARLQSADGTYCRDCGVGQSLLIPASAGPMEWRALPGGEPAVLLSAAIP